MEQPEEKEQLFIELGAFIKILAPSNTDINDNTYYIQYLDDNEIDMINIDTLNKKTLTLTNGDLDDKSIEEFEILSRPQQEGYARQNDLLPGTWLTIQFGGEVPMTINGQITNLEEDMIEISTWPDNKKIYIDFAYKGIPKNLDIESIRPFVPPQEEEDKSEPPNIEISPNVLEEDDEILSKDVDELDLTVPDVRAQRKEILLNADEIEFGEVLDQITQYVPVKEEERRFGIETQTNDLLNDILSTIPTSERTQKVLKSIHTMIERFQQLRKNFSKLSSDGEYEIPDKKSSNYKPLIDKLLDLSKKLYWLLPIAKNKKTLYDVTVDVDDNSDDIIDSSLAEAQTEIYNIVEQFKTNNIPDGENKYKFLMKSLNKYLTPFVDPDNKNDILFNGEVNTSLNVIIDNLEGLYSSVFCEEKFNKMRFVFSRYNQGLTIPEIKNIDAKKKQLFLDNITKNDEVYLRGYMQLPQLFMRYSQINLPKTKIGMRASLNQIPFNYFTYLNNKDPIDLNVNILSLDNDEIQENFLKGFQAYIFEKTEDMDFQSKQKYRAFLENIIPKTRTLINTMKKYIPNGVSYFKILFYLQPFLVFSDDITFKQYEEIVNFMRQNILDFKKDLVKNRSKYLEYINHDYNADISEKLSYLYNVLDKSQNDVEILYRFLVKNDDGDEIRESLNTSEFMKNILEIDNGNLFMSSVAFEDIELFVSSDIDSLINKRLDEINGEKKEEENTECKNFVLAKKYIDFEELKEDDGNPEIYFDNKYDETRYDIIEEFSTEQANMSPSNFNDFLVEHLITNAGLDEVNAQKEARAMIDKKRIVSEGDYAFFTNESGENIYYYRDNNNTWIHDKDLDGEQLGSSTFCNLKNNCMDINDNCGTIGINRKKIQEQLLNDMLKQFNDEIHLDSSQLKQLFTERKQYYASIINELLAIKYLDFTKYDRIKYNIALKLQDRTVITSPFEELRDRILSQTDFVKKQNDIIKFIDKNCREYNYDSGEESPYWYYCIRTNVKLLPTFYKPLAESYMTGNYLSMLDKISAERGTKSDDGDKIVDKHSGYLIRMIDFDEAEGYDEAGYKIVSRAVMEEDIADIIMDIDFKPTQGLRSKDGQMIRNIVTTLQQQLSISIKKSMDFIVKEVESTLDELLPSKNVYEKQVEAALKKRKKMSSYIDLHDEALLMLTLAYFLVVSQTMIPSVKTDRTFKGCGPKSFNGYPTNGAGDYSSLKYIACSALKLRSRTRPWNILPRVTRQDSIKILKSFMSKLKNVIDKQVLSNHLIEERIALKLDYLSNREEDEIIREFNVKSWLTFLPPLIPINIDGAQELGATFRENLVNSITQGNNNQTQLMNILSGRMTIFSMKLQQEIQNVIKSQSIILSNIENDFLVENSCCNTGEKIFYKYLQEKQPQIKTINDRIQKYNDIQNYVESLIIPYYLFDEADTKVKYPQVPNKFSESTIYSAFIRFCYFNSGIILDDELSLVCGKNISAFKQSNSIEDKIAILKKEGKNYDEASFLRLMDIVNRSNSISINFRNDIFSPRIIFEKYIKNDEIKSDVDGSDLEVFMELIGTLIDRYDVLVEDNGNSDAIINLISFLDSTTNEMVNEIIDFTNLSFVDNGKLLEFINTIDNWKLRGDNIYMSLEDETAFTVYTYFDTYIKNISEIYPTIISNKVNMKTPSMPEHWMKGSQKLSDTHVKDIRNIITSEHSELYEFYGNVRVNKIISAILDSDISNILIKLSNLLPFFSNIRFKPNTERKKTILNGDMLKKISKYLFIKTLHTYIETVKNLDLTDEIKISMGNVGEQLEEDILRGREMEVRYDISNLLIGYLRIMHKQKKVLNISNKDINENVLKSKEKEKAKITKNLGDLSVEERKVQDIMKNHRIGEWSLGQTSALYIYDENQYEKERMEIMEDALRELELGGIDGVSERNSQIISFDLDQERAVQARINRELNAAIMANGDDDDFGDRDDDAVDYMDAIRRD